MKHLFLKIMLVFATTLNSSCEEQNTNDSIGNDTFSCYINGEKYIPSAGTAIGGGNIRPFSWSYGNENDSYITIQATNKNWTFFMNFLNPKTGKNILNEELSNSIDYYHSGMVVHNSNEFYNTRDNQNNSFVTFTELSETNAIGTFECTLYDENGKELKVTNGKFNLSLDSRTN